MIKVLFVEDDPDQIMLYGTKFEMEGVLTMPALNSGEALKYAVHDGPDLILLDILLRNENGLDILEKLKRDDRTKDIPVIVFTNYTGQEARERAQTLGALDFIVKSETVPREMAEKIRTLIGQKK